jgi:hypothetical protein
MLVTQTGGTAIVNEDLGFGPPYLRWTVIHVNTGWYVDDQDQGCPQTTIYSPAYDHRTDSSTPPPATPQC